MREDLEMPRDARSVYAATIAEAHGLDWLAAVTESAYERKPVDLAQGLQQVRKLA